MTIPEPATIGEILARRKDQPRRQSHLMDAIEARGVRPATMQDRNSLLRVCQLVLKGQLGEHWLMSAAEAVRIHQPDYPVRYFFATLRAELRQAGGDFAVLGRKAVSQ